jgi:hypothetical protein
VGFLHSPQPPLRQIALENVAPFAQGQHTYIFKQDDFRPIKDLKILVRDKTERTVQLALSILVNLCDDSTILDNIASDDTLVEFVIHSIFDMEQVHTDLFCILLANLAKNDQVIKIFDWKKKHTTHEFRSESVIDCLMDCFVTGSERKLNEFANFDYLAFVFSDLSRFKRGREYFVTKQIYDDSVPITKLVVFTECESKIRRAGVASTIKNALFDVNAHKMLVIDPSINLLPYILLPLAGPEELPEDDMFELPEELQLLPPDKKREPDHQILCTHVESLLLLSTTRPIREYMRTKNVYVLIREVHKAVEDDVVQDPCERLVQMLMRDEAPESKLTEMEDDEEIVEVL